jgi:hypothetical protein
MSLMMSDGSDPLRRRRWLAAQAEWIASGSRATELGRRARRAYLDRNQIRNLQRVAETSAAVSTLTDYVKTQTGKHPLWRRENFGPMLLDDLDRLQSRLGGDRDGGGTYADLCRLYVRQLAASYVYSIAVDATGPRPAPAARAATPPRSPARPPRQRGPRTVAPPEEQAASLEPADAVETPTGGAAGEDAPDVTADAELPVETADAPQSAEAAGEPAGASLPRENGGEGSVSAEGGSESNGEISAREEGQ